MLVLTLGLALPALAQQDESKPQLPPIPPEQLEQIKRMMQEDLERALRERRGLADERDEVDERLQRLLAEHRIALQAAQGEQPARFTVQGQQVIAQTYTDPLADRSRQDVVALLNDEDFVVREQAQTHLLMDDTLDIPALRELIRDVNSDEQRYRLLRVAEHHVLRLVRLAEFGPDALPADAGADDRVLAAPRRPASIGFSYSAFLSQDNPVTNTPGVIVTATMPGFPGHAQLRVGDQIVSINRQTARGINHRELLQDWVKNRIGFNQAGDTIILTVIRGSDVIEVPIVCAQGAALFAMYDTNGLDASFRMRPYTEKWLTARSELVEGLPAPTVLTPKAE